MRSVVPGVTLLLALALLPACDATGPRAGPPASIRKSPLPTDLVVGDVVDSVAITVVDKDRHPVEGAAVAWTTTDGALRSTSGTTDADGVASTSWTLATTSGQQRLTATVGTLEAVFQPYVSPGPLAALVLDVGDTTLTALGDTLRLHADGRDRYDNHTATAALTWMSTDPGVVSVSAGTVVARGEGDARIVVASGASADTARLTVRQVVTTLTIDPAAPALLPTESVRMTAVPADARGNPVDTTMQVTWSTSDESVATVDGDGMLHGVAAGDATVTAAAGPFTVGATVRVRTGPRPTISDISPAVLGAHDTATITGTGFAADPALNRVSVGEIPGTVLDAAPTRITVLMPGAGAFPCGPRTDMDVMVSVDDLTATRAHPVAGADHHALAVGESMVFQGAAAGCNELTESGEYVVTVFNGAPSLSVLTGFRLRGTANAAPGSLRTGEPTLRQFLSFEPAAARLPENPDALGHLRMLDANEGVLRRLGPPRRTPLAPNVTGAGATASATTPPRAGDVRTFRIPNIDGNELCSDYSTITARVAYAGTRGIIWEDTAAPLAGRMDTAWARLGQEFDDVMYPVLLQYFGDPLIYDPQLDDNGRFFMLFSRKVNDFTTGVEGFVFSGDFFPRVQCQSSDAAEMFYGRVPTDTAAGYTGNTILSWRWGMRSTVIHEVKHITSYSHKLAAAGSGAVNWEEQWLEESTARLAEEYYARALFGFTQTSNVTYQQSIYCERRVGPNWPECDPFPLIMGNHFGGLNTYYHNIEARSPLGRTGEGDWSFYGSGWLFVQWAIDQSGMDEAAFIKAMVDEPRATGVDNIAVRTGRSFRDLLADFSLAMAVDDHPSGFAPLRHQLTIPGWNTRNMFSGLHDDYAGTGLASTYDLAWPLATHAVSFGDFTIDVSGVRGGSTAVFSLSGAFPGGQLIELLSPAGGETPSNLGLAVVRVQ